MECELIACKVSMDSQEWRFRGRKALSRRDSKPISAVRRLQGVLRPSRQQAPSHQVQVGERKQGVSAHRVLEQATITNDGEAPQSFHDPKGKLTASAPTGTAAIERLLLPGQLAPRLGAPIDPIVDARALAMQAVVLAPIGLVAVEFPLLAMQEFIEAADVLLPSAPGHQAVYQALFAGAYVHFHPKVPLPTLLGLLHLRIAALRFVLGGAGRVNDGGVDDRPRFQQQAFVFQQRAYLGKDLLCQLLPLQQMSKVQDRGLV